MGIVCVTIDDEPIEIVVKINDLLQKATESDGKSNASDSESESLMENSGEMQSPGVKKRRAKRRRRASGKQSCDSMELNSSDGATFDSLSNNENNSTNVAASWRSPNATYSGSANAAACSSASGNWKCPTAVGSSKQPTSNEMKVALDAAGAIAAARSGRFECHACTFRFATARALKNHVQSSGHKAYKCVDCGALRKNWSGLELHCLRHVNVRRWSCMVCNDEFFSRPACIAHLESAHTAELARAKQPGDLVHTKELDASSIAYLERMKLANGFSVNQTPLDYAIPKRESLASAPPAPPQSASSASGSASNSRPPPLTATPKRLLDTPIRDSIPLTANLPNRGNPILFSISSHAERGEPTLKNEAEALLKSPPLMSVQSYE